jgi:transposase-like protein
VAHRIREAMREAKDIQLGDPDTTVEIDETYIGGQLRHKGSKVAKASKTMVIGMAERNGRIHLESMSNRRFESIKPVLDAKLAENTKEVVTDGNPSYKGLIPKEKHSRGNHGKELRERVWTTTQTVENAFSLFKRAIVGNYHKLSPWHLDRYMREFCWRYNRRRMQASIFDLALTSMVSRTPLPYKTLVAF